MTIPEVSMIVLENYPEGLTAAEIYDQIIKRQLYPNFQTVSVKDGIHITENAIKRSCIDTQNSLSTKNMRFRVSGNDGKKNRYALLHSTSSSSVYQEMPTASTQAKQSTVHRKTDVTELEKRMAEQFPAFCIRKGLAAECSGTASMPLYAVEALLGIYCTCMDEAVEKEGISETQRLIDHYVLNERNTAAKQTALRSGAPCTVLSQIKTTEQGRIFLNHIAAPLLSMHGKARQGSWCFATIRPGEGGATAELSPISMTGFVKEELYRLRNKWNPTDWIRLLANAAGESVDSYGEREQLLYLLRFVPLVQESFTLLTSNCTNFRSAAQLSPYAAAEEMISPEEAERWDCLICSRMPSDHCASHIVSALNHETAVYAVHNGLAAQSAVYLSGQELPVPANFYGYGWNCHYLAQFCHEMRKMDRSSELPGNYQLAGDNAPADEAAVRAVFSGMAKLLYPGMEMTENEKRKLLNFALERRLALRRLTDPDADLHFTEVPVPVQHSAKAEKRKSTMLLPDDEWTRLLRASDIVDLTAFVERYGTKIRSVIHALEKNYEMVEFEEKQYITLRCLEKQDIHREQLLAYCDAVYDAAGALPFFTVYSLRKAGIHLELDDLGFDDCFYNCLLRNDTRFSSVTLAGTQVFSAQAERILLADMVCHVVRERKVIGVDQLVEEMKAQYGVLLKRATILTKIKNTELYYDKIMDCLYKDYDTYYEDI